jgi:hypothetical protein
MKKRVVRYVAILLSNTFCFALGAAVGNYKLTTQRERTSDDRLDTNSVAVGMLSGWNWVTVNVKPASAGEGER